jgi:WhiB family transcriptional regulator, redox-sensing transcriptional regulator
VAEDREIWREAAACRDTDPELFFPISSHGQSRAQSARAKAFCTHCPVVRCCLDFALRTRQMHGVWGGMTEEERIQKLLQDRQEACLAAGRTASAAAALTSIGSVRLI